jgi:hypothetical protein
MKLKGFYLQKDETKLLNAIGSSSVTASVEVHDVNDAKVEVKDFCTFYAWI